MARIPFPDANGMTPAQQAVYDDIVAGKRGAIVGPLRAALHNPALAMPWHKLGEALRFSESLPAHLRELAIIMVGRRWGASLEFHLHAQVARKAGLPDGVIEAVRLRSTITTDATLRLLADGATVTLTWEASFQGC